MVDRFDGPTLMQPYKNGDFVRYSDYAELEAEKRKDLEQAEILISDLRSVIIHLEAQIAEKEAENELLKIESKAERLMLKALKEKAEIERDEALSLTGAVKVKALDEDDYVEIIDAAANAMRRASSGARGQTITVQDSLDWWVMKETERRILAALEPAAPEGQQPVAYRVHAPEDEYYGVGPDRLQFHPLSQHDLDTGYRQTPLYTSPSEQAVTEAMVEAMVHSIARQVAKRDGYVGQCDARKVRIDGEFIPRAALKAAMEAGRHE